MPQICDSIVFSSRAYNAIMAETYRKDPLETGGILIGHILDSGTWVVVDMIPPGIKTVHREAYFEWDTELINYLSAYACSLYELKPNVLGFWHRHPGSMDTFSGTDDGTNLVFAKKTEGLGIISGIVNVDPEFRLTMYHVSVPLSYSLIRDVLVDDSIIPEEYLRLKYHNSSGVSGPIIEEEDTQVASDETPYMPIWYLSTTEVRVFGFNIASVNKYIAEWYNK